MEHVRTLIDADRISQRVRELGRAIQEDHPDGVVLIVILKGSFIFAADLCRAIQGKVTVEFLGLRSYEGTASTGVVQITSDLSEPIQGKDVIVVEDIVDTGLTMQYLMENLGTRGPNSIKVASLLHKPSRTQAEVRIDYLGFTVEDVFVVGYGLDRDQRFRNLPFIGLFEQS
ncbi:MAG: hypoxanthine phosphoribosyltransferase [Myxococcota bacterium]